MSEFCEHETFKDICGICHRNARITALRAENERLKVENEAVLSANRDVMLHWDVLKADYEKLRAALKKALSSDGGVAYDGDEDNVGYRVCCGWSTYKPHEADCWVTEARAALEEKQ